MSSKYKYIKISPGLSLQACLGGEAADAGQLRDMIIGEAIHSDDEPNKEALKGLVNAYVALTEEEPKYRDILDSTSAELCYTEFCIRGFRQGVKGMDHYEEYDDEAIYESCPWFELDGIFWPDQLIAEIGFLAGYKAGADSKAFCRYVQEQEATKGKDWWKNA
jgi:hypothetical protein